MALTTGNLYEASKLAGSDGAREAAEDVASYDNRIGDPKTESVRGGFGVVKWMLGFNIAMTVAIVRKLFLTSH